MRKVKCDGCGRVLPAYRIGPTGLCSSCKEKIRRINKKKGGK